MRRCFIIATLAVVASVQSVAGSKSESDVAQLVAFTRTDHSTIFFTGPSLCGYARDGVAQPLVLRRDAEQSAFSGCSNMAVSHDANRILYGTLYNSKSGPGELVLRDLPTGKERALCSFERGGRLFSWSWDDREVAYEDKGDLLAVSVSDGSKRVLVKDLSARIRQAVPAATESSGADVRNVDWLHDGKAWMVSAIICLPTPHSEWCTSHSYALLITPTEGSILVEGWGAALSSSTDAVAYISSGLEIIDVASKARRSLTGMPRFLGLFFEESPWSTAIWSPDANRIWFNTILDEGGNQNAYVVDVKLGRRERILKKTLVAVTDWRR